MGQLTRNYLPIRVLLIEDNPADVRMVREMLSEAKGVSFKLEHTDYLSAGLKLLAEGKFDLLLLDLNLPDSYGLETFEKARVQAPGMPIIALTSLEDESLAIKALQLGAQDYLVKGEINSTLLVRSILYSLERKRAEEALRESEERLQLALSCADMGIWRWDLVTGTDVRDANMNRILGLDPVGSVDPEDYFMQCVHADDRIGVEEIFERISRGEGKDFQAEFRVVRPDGAVRWLSSKGKVIYNRKDVPVCLTGAAFDITERKQAEESIKKSEAQLAEAQQIAHIGSWEWDIASNKVSWSDELYRIFGLRPQEIEITYEEFLIRVHPDDRDFVKEKIQEALVRHEPFGFDHRIVTPDGTVRILYGRGRVVVDEYGNPVKLIGIGQDITERRQVEKALARLASFPEQIPNPVVEVDFSGNVTYLNPAAQRLFPDLYEKGFEHPIMEGVKLALASFRDRIPESLICEINKGSRTYEQLICYTSESALFRIYSTDITKRKQAEEALRKAHYELEKRVDERTAELLNINEELRSSYEQLRALAAHLQSVREERARIAREVHDELGQALTALKIDLSWLGDQFTELYKLGDLSRITDEAQSGLMVKIQSMFDLIDMTIQSVRRIATELRPGMLDDLGLVAAIEWQAQDFQGRTGIQYELFIENGEDTGLDKELSTALFHIFQETLTNVARHARATRVSIRLAEDTDTLRLEIEDNGKGITEEDISDPKSLGLLGIRERALLFGGDVSITGSRGKGTRISVSIPLAR